MSEPKRVQLSRRKGYRKPEGAIVVARPTRWGNPYVIGSNLPELFIHHDGQVVWTRARAHGADLVARSVAVGLYRMWITDPDRAQERAAVRAELAGHDLACWCPLDQPCHADVLLELANRPEEP